MKKILTILIAGICTLSLAAQSDEELNSTIWGKGRFFHLGYTWAQTADEYSPVEKSKFSFFLTKGTTYYFPKKPIAGMLKIGIDAVWCDIQVSKYGNPYANMTWTSEFEDLNLYDDEDFYGFNDDEDEGAGGLLNFDLNKIGCWGLAASLGVGPNVSVAPFALTNINIMKPLRVQVYFHYAPTMQLYMKSQNDDIELSTAFVNMMNLGLNLQYRKIGIGYEARWGKGKFKPIDFGSIIFDNDSPESNKYTRRFANNRLYINFTF